MMDLNRRISAFAELGTVLRDVASGKDTNPGNRLSAIIETQHVRNAWFTPENVRNAIGAIGESLRIEKLNEWTARYPQLNNKGVALSAAVIMAGNIPLVGFHDYLSVLISGNKLLAKTSSKDSELIREITQILVSVEKEFADKIAFAEGELKNFDVVIATGSDNSSRYFEYYFGKYPHIIRKNRNSIAIITGDESKEELSLLGRDVFSYFGLGCRSVSKIYIPQGYHVEEMTPAWNGYSGIINHSKYANNYEYNMAVFMVNREKFSDTGFLLLRENPSLSSPVAVLHYQFYNNQENLYSDIELQKDKIQCIVSEKGIPFGMAQSPELWDYSDNIDTLDFLLKKNMSGIL
jgi:hypothetical protein